MNRIVFLSTVFIMISSCGGRGVFDSPADYLGGNELAAIEQACHKRGGSNKESAAWDLCVQSQKIHNK